MFHINHELFYLFFFLFRLHIIYYCVITYRNRFILSKQSSIIYTFEKRVILRVFQRQIVYTFLKFCRVVLYLYVIYASKYLYVYVLIMRLHILVIRFYVQTQQSASILTDVGTQ